MELFYMLLCLGMLVTTTVVLIFLQFVSTLKEYIDKGVIMAAILYIVKRFTK